MPAPTTPDVAAARRPSSAGSGGGSGVDVQYHGVCIALLAQRSSGSLQRRQVHREFLRRDLRIEVIEFAALHHRVEAMQLLAEQLAREGAGARSGPARWASSGAGASPSAPAA